MATSIVTDKIQWRPMLIVYSFDKVGRSDGRRISSASVFQNGAHYIYIFNCSVPLLFLYCAG